jgi:hypothetical protein
VNLDSFQGNASPQCETILVVAHQAVKCEVAPHVPPIRGVRKAVGCSWAQRLGSRRDGLDWTGARRVCVPGRA